MRESRFADGAGRTPRLQVLLRCGYAERGCAWPGCLEQDGQFGIVGCAMPAAGVWDPAATQGRILERRYP